MWSLGNQKSKDQATGPGKTPVAPGDNMCKWQASQANLNLNLCVGGKKCLCNQCVFFFFEDQVLSSDHPLKLPILANNRQMSQTHGAEEHEAPSHDGICWNGVASGVHVVCKVDHLVQVFRLQAFAHSFEALAVWIACASHGFEGYMASVRAFLTRFHKCTVRLAQLQQVMQRVPLHEAQEARAAHLNDRKAMVMAATEDLQKLSHCHLGRDHFHASFHHMPCLNGQRVLLGKVLQQRHLLQADVDVVEPLVEFVSCPFGSHDSDKDWKSELCVSSGLHQDHRQRNGNACHSGEKGCGANEGIDARSCFNRRGGLHKLAYKAPQGGASKETWHEKSTGHTQAIGPTCFSEVYHGENQEHAPIEVSIVVKECLDAVVAALLEEQLSRGKVGPLSFSAKYEWSPKVHGGDD
mmetsp:Transcript_22638/g.40917  ORF Transcript_22638/g.40917 Transcript_22638/m.40917 type:complete len:409 (+) Transcript_22638:182-1408(+)